jgi:DNA-binding LytR/AlgR family response regulator
MKDGTISVVTRTVEGHSNCRTLEELMDQLDLETFWRAHRSYVVNLPRFRDTNSMQVIGLTLLRLV